MIFAQTNRYGKRQDTFSQDDRQGASVAHAELLRGVIAYSDVEAVELFVNTSPNRPPIANLEFADLCREFPNKSIRLRSLDDISALSPLSRYVFYSSGIYISPLAQARRAAGLVFPICSLSHALDIPIVNQFIPGALLLSNKHDTIITSSSAGKRVLEASISLSREILSETTGVPLPDLGPRVDVIPLGVNVQEFSPTDRSIARSVLRVPPDEIVLLYLGRLNEEHKADLEPLLIVLRELLRKSPKVSLYIAGHDQGGTYLGELENLASRLGVRNHVRFLINFQDFLKPYIYSASDIFVAPSDNIQETFGIAIIEAMACGLPVVASNWSGYRELVIHNRTGFLVPTFWNKSAVLTVSERNQFMPDEARRHILSQQTVVMPSDMHKYLEALIDNTDLRKDFGREGSARVHREFSWQKVTKMHQSLWEELWAGIDANAPPEKHLFEDLDFMFSGFASSSLDLDSVITRSVMRADIDNALRSHPSRPGYDMIDAAELRRIADRTLVGPASIRQLLRDGTVKDTIAVVWLIKKGFLTIALTDDNEHQ